MQAVFLIFFSFFAKKYKHLQWLWCVSFAHLSWCLFYGSFTFSMGKAGNAKNQIAAETFKNKFGGGETFRIFNFYFMSDYT